MPPWDKGDHKDRPFSLDPNSTFSLDPGLGTDLNI